MLVIEYLPIDTLKPYEKNAKIHTEEQVEQIKKSIQEFGMNDPVAIWGENNTIIEGHGRLIACKQLGFEEVPVIRLDGLTDDQRKAYTLIHNKLTMNTDFDVDILNDELAEINIDMSDYGFDLEEINIDLGGGIGEDNVPEPDENAEPKAKLGDIYKLGNHRLMCGDSTNKDNVAKLLNGQKADMVFTDPPYGYNYQSNMRTKSQKFDVIENDDKILDFFPNTKEFCKGFIFVCTTWKVLDKWIPLFKKYYDLSNMIIWNKGGGGIGDLKHTFSTDYEVILCTNNGNEITGKRIGSVWTISKDNANDYDHPTQKPVELSAMAIENTTHKGDNVLDFFGGSGSTLIACEHLKRNCFCMELDPKYVDVIVTRWENITGQKAELIEG